MRVGKSIIQFQMWIIWRLIVAISGLTVANLMKMLTGWRLLFSEDAPSVILRSGRHFPKQRKMGRALVTVWEREVETGIYLQLLVRAPSTSGESRDTTWLSAPRECYSHFELDRAPVCIEEISPPNLAVQY